MKIFLDFDGTIIDSRERVYNLFADLTSTPISFEDYWELKRNQKPNEWILREMMNYNPEQVETFQQQWHKDIEEWKYLEMDKLFPFAAGTLRRLSDHAQLILVTGRQSKINLDKQLDRFSISSFFNAILNTANKIEKHEIIRNHEINCSPDDIFAGDTGKDIEAGKMLGVRTVGVLSGFRNNSSLSRYQPDYLFENISLLESLIKK